MCWSLGQKACSQAVLEAEVWELDRVRSQTTCCFSCKRLPPHRDASLNRSAFPQVYVLKRPYVDEFLRRMGELFECVLFTASLAKVPGGRRGEKNREEVWLRQGCSLLVTRMSLGNQDCSKQKRLLFFQYADPVTDLLDRCGVFRARLFRESCVFHQGCYVKDLSRLGRDLRKTLILDNSPASYIFHPENAVSGPDTPTLHGLGEFLPQWERGWAGELWALPGGRTTTSGPHQPAGALQPGEEELAGGLCYLSPPAPGACAVLV